MPNWSGTVLTAKGRALQAKVEAGTVMNITKLKIGDGTLGAGQTVDTLNDLVAPKQIVDISSLTPMESGVCKIFGIVTNDDLETGFYVRELGVFAQDPVLGEILYAYTADGAPDFLPAAGGSVAVSEELVINLAFSNAAIITANISMDGLITANILQQHNTDEDAHAELMIAHNTSTAAHADLLHLRQNTTTYTVGDIAYSPTLPSYAYLECIQAGTTAAVEPAWPAVGEEVTDGTVRWRVRDIKDCVSIATFTTLANEVANKLNAAETGFVFIYPNGGTAASPANVAPNTRYICDNPFPDYYVTCQLELKVNGEWTAIYVSTRASTGGTNYAYGGTASQSDADHSKIIVRTLGTGLFFSASYCGGSVEYDTGNNNGLQSAPCRVKVWKNRGLIT
ncbi:hypothetical protein SDC9_04129 [bioreactor metagenome]|uniref:Uncharacterized protein n=1 Tax=bioreactor metagenome TaxID=1076179 RepID=A0A644SVE4_9ZZZZ|nr:hypothetical protein [Negativicutes bacterium]